MTANYIAPTVHISTRYNNDINIMLTLLMLTPTDINRLFILFFLLHIIMLRQALKKSLNMY